MKNNLKWLGGTLVLVFMLASCTSTAHIEKDDNADFSHYKTFAWIDKDGAAKKNNDILEQKVKQAVNKELAKSAGWRETKNHPDLLLSYDVLVERSTKQNNDPVYSQPYSRLLYNPYARRYTTVYYPSQFLGYDRDNRPIKEGTVTITMLDARTDKMVWQGWSTDEVNNRNMTSKEVQNSVKAIFRKFDVAKN
jgi:Domain of unknown function (DUF4136)